MGAGQLSKVEGGVANPQGQLASVRGSVPVVAAVGKGHLSSVVATVPVVAPVGKGQLSSVSAVVPSLFSVEAGAAQTVEPFATVTVTATPVNGSVASWEWVQSGGSPAVVLQGTGATRTLKAPATVSGAVLSFLVTGNNGVQSATDSVNVTVYPNDWWVFDGSAWVALRQAVVV